MKYLILGSTGLLGQALIKECQIRKIEYIGVARHYADLCVDICDDTLLENTIISSAPDIVINTCAIVNHKICDENPEFAYKTNARPSSILVNLACKYNFKYVYISTDGYFSGDKDKKHDELSHIKLLNEYARTKFAGECFALTNHNSLVVRTNIIGFRNQEQPTFLEWVINALKTKAEMTLFDDYYTSSITTTQFSSAVLDLIIKDAKGIYNLASSEVFSKAKFIESVAKTLGLPLENAKVGSVNLLSSKRADSLGLEVSKAEKFLGYKLPNLEEVMQQIKKDYKNV